jgi:hypothetical protein
MGTFQEHKAKTTSEKIVLAWLEPSQRLFSWSVYSGSVYSRAVSFYVVGVRQDSVALIEVSSLAAITGAGEWYFNPSTKTLYVWSAASANPASVWTDVTYRLFFSNAPIDLPAKLVDGTYTVPYEPYVQTTSKFKESFSDDQKGIALEGTGNIVLHNNDGYFATLYDRLIWENKACRIFSYARDVAVSEAVTLFNGVVTGKAYADEKVTFQLANFIYKLRSELPLPVYTATDGTLPGSLLGRPKRRIYGRADGLSCGPLNTMSTSYALQTVDPVTDLRTGTAITVTLTNGSNVAVASSTDVHKDLCAGDSISVSGNTFKVKSLARVDIGLDTQQTITLSLPGGPSTTTARLAFAGIVTTSVSAGDHISLSVLSNSAQVTKSVAIGHFPVVTVNAAYIEFTLPTVSTMATDIFKTGVGEIAVTRHTNTTSFTVQNVSAVGVSGVAATVTPSVSYRRFNRLYALAHHVLSTKATTVVGLVNAVKFSVADADGMYVGDVIRIAGNTLSTITGLDRTAKLITVADVILPFPSLGTTVERLGIQRVTFEQQTFTQFTDFNPIYSTSIGSQLQFGTRAEFNAAATTQLASRVAWYNTSKQVLGSNGVFAGLKPRDWIASQTDNVWYEIAEKFSDNLVILNTPYTGTSGTNTTSLKQPNYLADVSTLIADVYGKTTDGTAAGPLIITGAAVVRDLMTDAGVSSLINATSFDAAAAECSYRISLTLPLTPTGNSPLIRDVVNYVNDSVLGSLFNGIDGTLQYRSLDASRALTNTVVLAETDLIGSTVHTDSSKIYSKVLVRFAARDADTVTEKPTYSVEQSSSDFVLNSGIEGTISTVQSYLYDRADAQILAQRIRFIHELAGSQLDITVSLLLVDAALNDLVTVTTDRAYARFGTPGSDRSKTGLISSIQKDGLTCRVLIDDLGNTFSRVATVTPNTALDFGTAPELERRFNGYITDTNGLQTADETTFNANLIG